MKRKSNLTLGKDNPNSNEAIRKRERNKLNNRLYRQRIKNDPARNKKRLDGAKARQNKKTKSERALREKDSKFREASRYLWRTRKQTEKVRKDRELQEETPVVEVEWEVFTEALRKQSRKRPTSESPASSAQTKRRKLERRVKATNLKVANKDLQAKVKSLQSQLHRIKTKYVPTKPPKINKELRVQEAKDYVKKISKKSSTLRATRNARKATWSFKVEEYLIKDWNSKAIPGSTVLDRRLTNLNRRRKQKKGLPVTKRVLKYRMDDMYKEFVKENPLFPYSVQTFGKMRPFYIITAKVGTKKAKCVCTKCSNIKRKLDVLNKFRKANGLEIQTETVKQLIDQSLCPYKTNYANLECLERNCGQCGTHIFMDNQCDIIGEDTLRNSEVNWTAWKNVDREKMNKRTGQIEKKNYNEITKEGGTVDILLREIARELEAYVMHDFRARWQWHQLKYLTQHLPEDQVLMIMDYSDNIGLQYSEETIASHAKAFSVSLFPVAVYYRDRESDEVFIDSVNIISNDTKHDGHAVRAFTSVALNHLKKYNSTAEIKVFHRFSDGCAGQFRSRHTMLDIASFSEYYPGSMCIAHYGESSEFKNICDGFGDHVKTPLKNAIIRNDLVIDSAKSVFDYLKTNLTFDPTNSKDRKMKRRSFYYVDTTEINRENRSAKPVPGLLSTHSAVGIKPGFVGLRKLTCCCNECLLDWQTEHCLNRHYVKDWKISHVKNETDTCCDRQSPCQLNANTLIATPNVEATQDATITIQITHQPLDIFTGVVAWKIDEMRIGEWLLVKFNMRKNTRFFIGQLISTLLDNNENQLEVKFVKQYRRTTNEFVWPEIPDISVVQVSQVVGSVLDPVVLRYGILEFAVDVSEWST